MTLTQTQKEQIRLMVSTNPSIDNMERVANLSDEVVLAELEHFKTNRLPLYIQEKTQMEQEAKNIALRIEFCSKVIELLEKE